MIGHPSLAVRLAVFDVAGTTVLDGDAVTECLAMAMRPRVAVTTADVLRVMGLPKPVAIRQLLSEAGWPSIHLEADTAATHQVFRATLMSRYRNGSLTPAIDATRVFAALRKAGVRVVLDTGFSRDILDVVLERLRWDDSVVDFSIASDEVERGRPYPDLIHRAMALARVAEPSMVAKIGDTPADIDQGLSARCGRVVGVTYGTHTREQLARPGVHIIDRLRELMPNPRHPSVKGSRHAVVGAGIVGLALARSLATRGAAVTVFEGDVVPQGASVRNFGTLWPIGQPAGPRRAMAMKSMAIWRDVLKDTRAWSAPDGSLHLAYYDDERAVLAEFASSANTDGFRCELFNAAQTMRLGAPIRAQGLIASLWSAHELQINPRQISELLPQWLAERYGVQYQRGARVTSCAGGELIVGRRSLQFDHIWVAPGADTQTLYPNNFSHSASGAANCR